MADISNNDLIEAVSKTEAGSRLIWNKYATNSGLMLDCCVLLLIYLLTAVDCGDLPDPANGMVVTSSGTTFTNTATYTCNPGYVLVGDATRTCQSTGVWNSTAPTCEGKLVH